VNGTMSRERGVQRGVIEIAQVAPKPDEGGRHP
jgi:hypothetical protein